MNYLRDFLDLILGLIQACLEFAFSFAMEHKRFTIFTIVVLVRLLGTTVQTGHKGVLFVFGRVRKELDPGFHFLVPLVMTVRKTPVRSVTLDMPKQRLTNADGLVYDVQTNIVYRVANPKLALTQVASLHDGIEALVPLIAQDLLRGLTRTEILDFKGVDAQFIVQAEQMLARWGVAVEQAGFKSIAPTKKTLHLTQLAILCAERQGVLRYLIDQGLTANTAIALLGADRRLVSHASARYRTLRHVGRPAAAPPQRSATAPLLPGEEPVIAIKPPQPQTPAAPEAQASELVTTVEAAMAQPTPLPPLATPRRKITTGIQPRSWLRLRQRLSRRVHLQPTNAKEKPVLTEPVAQNQGV